MDVPTLSLFLRPILTVSLVWNTRETIDLNSEKNYVWLRTFTNDVTQTRGREWRTWNDDDLIVTWRRFDKNRCDAARLSVDNSDVLSVDITRLCKGSFINDVTQICPFLTPSLSATLLFPMYLCHTIITLLPNYCVTSFMQRSVSLRKVIGPVQWVLKCIPIFLSLWCKHWTDLPSTIISS